jgi:hypothetical protein
MYVNSPNQRYSKKIIKTFQIENLPPLSTTPVVHLELRISPRIFEKIRNDLNGILTLYKKVSHFLFPSGMSLTKLFLAGNNLIIPGQGEFGQ